MSAVDVGRAEREVGAVARARARFEVEIPAEVVEEITAEVTARVLERLGSAAAPPSEFLSVDEAADLIRAKPQRIYDLCSAGRLTRHKDGSTLLIRRSELLDHVAPALPRGPRSRMASGVPA